MLSFLPAFPSAAQAPLRLGKVLLAPEARVTAELPLDLPDIPSVERFEALTILAGGDLVANGRVGKFLIDLRSGTPVVHFVNSNFVEGGVVPDSAKYHYFFAQAALSIPDSLEDFNRLTYFTEPKTRYVAGVLHTYFLEGSTKPVYGLQFYPQDIVREQGIVDALLPVKAQMTIPGARFAFVPTGSQQTTATVAAELGAAGVEIIPLDRILGSIRYIPLNTGEAWGYLRIFPASNDALEPVDIPVFDELPLDLSVVAGVITKAVQDSNSHVNLKSKERGTPNMVLRDAGPDHPRISPWRDKPVHFVVRADDFVLEASTDEEVAKHLGEHNNQPWAPLPLEPEKKLRSFDEMASFGACGTLAMAARYGSKASNLGFLAHASVLGRADQPGTRSNKAGYDLVPRGFGIPLSYYRNFVEHPPNDELRDALDNLVADEKAGKLSSAKRARRVQEVQTLFLNAKFPQKDLVRIEDKIKEVLPGVKKIKVRSSANAEDIANFDGAGLYDSFAARVGKNGDGHRCQIEADPDGGSEVKRKVKPKTVACAVKGVYASLWNKRAIEERSFARIDHATAAMGIAVVAAYDLEDDVTANAVVITRVINAGGVYGYTLSMQEGNNLVTNPDPGTYSEVTVAAIGLGDEPTSLTVTRHAKPAPDAPERIEPVLSKEQTLAMVDLASAVERGYCAADRPYYRGNCHFVVVDNEKPRSLDMEVKVLAVKRFLFKQVREFGGR
jgi:hypothetical protein